MLASSGDVVFTASESAGAGDHLTISAGASISALTGNVSLSAGDSISGFAGASIQAPNGSITLAFKANDADGVGTLLT